MKEKLIELLGLDADASDELVLDAVATLKRITNSPGAKQEKQIREKMAAGLSRETAIQVLKDQAQEDALQAERAEEAYRAERQRKAEAAKAAAASEPAKQ